MIADAALRGIWSNISFFDDAPEICESTPEGWNVKGQVSALLGGASDFDGVIVGVGDSSIRSRLQNEVVEKGLNLVSVIHPSAEISKFTEIGRGVAIFAGAVVNAGCVVGDGAIINTNATVDHDCRVGEFAHVCTGASLAGGVVVGAGGWVGVGSCVRQGIVVGSSSIIGAGAVVVADVAVGATVVGCPARPI